MSINLEKQWHHFELQSVLEHLGGDAGNGLDSSEVDSRRNRFGPNIITERKGQGPLLRFLIQFHQPLIYLFNCRSLTRSVLSVGLFSNRSLLLGVAAMLSLQVMFTYLQFMNTFFHTVPISLEAWGRIILVGLFASLTVAVEKSLRRGAHDEPAREVSNSPA